MVKGKFDKINEGLVFKQSAVGFKTYPTPILILFVSPEGLIRHEKRLKTETRIHPVLDTVNAKITKNTTFVATDERNYGSKASLRVG